MLKNVKEMIKNEQVNPLISSDPGKWSTSNYQYDSDSYNYDEVDLTDIASISTAYMDICALSNATYGIIDGLGGVTNSNNVQNVDLSGMNGVSCVKGINGSMGTMMKQYGNFVNSCYENMGSNGVLFTDQDGTKIDNYAEYLKEYAKSGSLSDVLSGGFEGLKMSNYGEFVSEAGDAHGNRPHFKGEAILPDGSINPEYEAYVNAVFYDDNGKCKFDGVTIQDLKINPSNGNVQVDFKDKDGIPFTLNCNLANPNALDNSYVSLPGDSGGGVYGSDNYSKVLSNVQYDTTNKFISFVFGAPTDHPYANAAITQIVDALNGETNLNKSVVSAASASEIYALDAVRALMTQSNSVDVMLLDSVRPGSEVCENFTKMLLGDNLKGQTIRNGKVIVDSYYKGPSYDDVLDYMRENGTVYAYVATRGGNGDNGSPSDAGSWLQQIANNGVRTVRCTNTNYSNHTEVEYQIFAGELERVLNNFQELPSNNIEVSNLVNSSNDYVVAPLVNDSNANTSSNLISISQSTGYLPYYGVDGISTDMIEAHDNNVYTIYEYKSHRKGSISDVAALNNNTSVVA